MSVKVQVLGLNQALNNLEQYLSRKKKGLLGVVAESSRAIQITAQQLAPIDLGELKDGIISTVIERKNSISGDVESTAAYSGFVEWGTRPHRPPYKALEGWSERHGIPTGAVVNKIAREGTPAQSFLTPAAMKEKNNFVRGVKIVMSKP